MMLRSPLLPGLAALLLFLGLPLTLRAEPLQPFLVGSLPSIESAHAQQPFLLVLWSVDCPPCFGELKMLAELRRERDDLRLVLLSADPPPARQEALELLEDYGLLEVESWQFGEAFPERLRHAVDPGWYGELPRSYFYRPGQPRSAHSGMLRREQVERWLRGAQESR